MNKLIVIVGPTSSHKTKLAVKLAKQLHFPLLNADAYQVYKEINCGTNKMTKQEIATLPVYLMDCISIYEKWDIKIFQDKAKEIIKKIYSQNKIPIVVGGSNLYVAALIKNYNLQSSLPRTDNYSSYTNQQLYDLLLTKDHLSAEKIGIGNKRRLIRALQIIDDTGISKSLKDLQKNNYYNCLIIYMDVERNRLYATINKRVQEMLDSGWKQEILELLNKDPNIMSLNALKAIGYKQVYDAIITNKPIDVALIAQKTRNYAKRQITWCNHQYSDMFHYHGKQDDKLLMQKLEMFVHD